MQLEKILNLARLVESTVNALPGAQVDVTCRLMELFENDNLSAPFTRHSVPVPSIQSGRQGGSHARALSQHQFGLRAEDPPCAQRKETAVQRTSNEAQRR